MSVELIAMRMARLRRDHPYIFEQFQQGRFVDLEDAEAAAKLGPSESSLEVFAVNTANPLPDVEDAVNLYLPGYKLVKEDKE